MSHHNPRTLRVSVAVMESMGLTLSLEGRSHEGERNAALFCAIHPMFAALELLELYWCDCEMSFGKLPELCSTLRQAGLDAMNYMPVRGDDPVVVPVYVRGLEQRGITISLEGRSDEGSATAILLAAAPRMFDVLQQFETFCAQCESHGRRLSEEVANIRQAISETLALAQTRH